MPPLSKERHFEILVAVAALAEERGSIALKDAADELDLEPEELRRLVDPLLYLEFYVSGHYVGLTHHFLLDGHDVLQLDVHGTHWLRDLMAVPPDRDSALRLLIAGTVYQAAARVTSPALDHALDKLAEHLAAELVMPVVTPPLLDTVHDAWRRMRSLRFRYVRAGHDDATEREMLPWRVYSRWGHWYAWGPEIGETEPKAFRVDRMVTATIGTIDVDPPPDLDPPDWFDLTEFQHTITVVAPQVVIDSLPTPHTIESVGDEPDGRVRATVTIAGERQLDHLLVALGPEGEVLEPPGTTARRRAWAARLLESITG